MRPFCSSERKLSLLARLRPATAFIMKRRDLKANMAASFLAPTTAGPCRNTQIVESPVERRIKLHQPGLLIAFECTSTRLDTNTHTFWMVLTTQPKQYIIPTGPDTGTAAACLLQYICTPKPNSWYRSVKPHKGLLVYYARMLYIHAGHIESSVPPILPIQPLPNLFSWTLLWFRWSHEP